MISETDHSNGWKPNEMCLKGTIEADAVEEFFFERKSELDAFFLQLDLMVRSVTPADYPKLMNFIKLHFGGHANMTPPRMYQIISFGESIMLVKSDGEIMGYILEVSYLRDKISHGASMAIHPELAGKSAGQHLFAYSTILAMKGGAEMKKGIISPDNFSSIKSIVNGCGATVVGFQEDLFGMGPKLIFNLPLVPPVLNHSKLDPAGVQNLLKSQKLGTVGVADFDAIKSKLKQRELIVALQGEDFITCDSAHFDSRYLG